MTTSTDSKAATTSTDSKTKMREALYALDVMGAAASAARTDNHTERVESVLRDILPHGSGIDADWRFEIVARSRGTVEIIAYNSFHRMDENGYYDGWSDFSVHIGPGYDPISHTPMVRIGGRGMGTGDLGDYLHESVEYALGELWANLAALRLALYHPNVHAINHATTEAVAGRLPR